ncbi:MAG: inorganic phosphate transporter [Christensenellaceae bacterium]|jgi:PiT family inorganic phosphate transporter|nr:inorganic phosphate transporter [Christensenellaceae bacterium]
MTPFAVVILMLAAVYTFYMGFNDGSNAIATTVATHSVRAKTAVYLAAAMKLIVPVAFFFIGQAAHAEFFKIAEGVGKKIINIEILESAGTEKGFAFLFSALLGAIIWGGIAFVLKVPNSTSHTILGGLIGSGIAAFGISAIRWAQYVGLNVILMVVLAPVIGFLVSFGLIRLVKLALTRVSRGINNIFVILQRINILILAGTFSLNNVQKALGIFLILGLVDILPYDTIQWWAVLIFAVCLSLGMIFGGNRIIRTIGQKIYKLQPLHSIVAQTATFSVMMLSTQLGISVSTGQLMSSSVIGAGAAERVSGVKWITAVRIVASWAFTLPIAGSVAAIVYLIVGKGIMHL